VKDERTGEHFFLTKGALESVGRGTQSVPQSLRTLCDSYTKTGFRVIAMASKRITDEDLLDIEMKSEDYFYKDLTMNGVLVFENGLKADTIDMIKQLKRCRISMAIVSGDNEYACAYNAYKIGIMDPKESLYFINFEPISKKLDVIKIRYLDGNLQISELDGHNNDIVAYLGEIFNDVNQHQTLTTLNLEETQHLNESVYEAKVQLCMRDYHFMLNNSSIEFLRSENFLESNILAKTRVFARMIPSSKAEVLTVYKGMLKHDHRIAFVGDGSNDVRAMKVADVGVSFLGCEASISAGFSIPFEQINKLPTVFAEGKACLDICVSLFKYICFYSLLLFAACMIVYLKNVDFSNGMYYIMDLFIIIPLSIFMCFHGASKLVDKYPISTLFTKEIIISLFCHWMIFITSGLLAAIQLDNIATLMNLSQNSVVFGIFLIAILDLLLLCVLFTRSEPFRVSMTTNAWLVGHILICLAIFLYIAYGSYSEFFNKGIAWFDDLLGVD